MVNSGDSSPPSFPPFPTNMDRKEKKSLIVQKTVRKGILFLLVQVLNRLLPIHLHHRQSIYSSSPIPKTTSTNIPHNGSLRTLFHFTIRLLFPHRLLRNSLPTPLLLGRENNPILLRVVQILEEGLALTMSRTGCGYDHRGIQRHFVPSRNGGSLQVERRHPVAVQPLAFKGDWLLLRRVLLFDGGEDFADLFLPLERALSRELLRVRRTRGAYERLFLLLCRLLLLRFLYASLPMQSPTLRFDMVHRRSLLALLGGLSRHAQTDLDPVQRTRRRELD